MLTKLRLSGIQTSRLSDCYNLQAIWFLDVLVSNDSKMFLTDSHTYTFSSNIGQIN